MNEHETPSLPYWQDDLLRGESRIRGARALIRLRLHTSVERSYGQHQPVRLSQPTGPRTFIHGEPDLREPQLSLAVDLFRHPHQEEVGVARTTDWNGVRHRPIGTLQAACYPEDRLLASTEGALFDPYVEPDPQTDALLTSLWTSFEALLVERSPATARLVTASWEELYEPADWRTLLEMRGYAPLSDHAFGKTHPAARGKAAHA